LKTTEKGNVRDNCGTRGKPKARRKDKLMNDLAKLQEDGQREIEVNS